MVITKWWCSNSFIHAIIYWFAFYHIELSFFLLSFFSVWTPRFLLYSLGYNPLLSLFWCSHGYRLAIRSSFKLTSVFFQLLSIVFWALFLRWLILIVCDLLDQIGLLLARNKRRSEDCVHNQLCLPHLVPHQPRAGGLNPVLQPCIVLIKQHCARIPKRALRPCNSINTFPNCNPLSPSKVSDPRARSSVVHKSWGCHSYSRLWMMY